MEVNCKEFVSIELSSKWNTSESGRLDGQNRQIRLNSKFATILEA